jgi:DNA polymerase III epsilon subunit-like protein
MTTRVMVDLETLGLNPGAAILSIGAVKFDRDGLGDEFHQNVSLESCQEVGLEIDADTLEWWLGQDESVQGVLTGGNQLSRVLHDFTAFYDGSDEIWAYSPQFDCSILAHAYDVTERRKPWTYRDERDCRTLASLSVWPDMEQEGELHDALADAKYQARQTIETLHRIES